MLINQVNEFSQEVPKTRQQSRQKQISHVKFFHVFDLKTWYVMKRMKINIALFAMVMGFFTAVAFKPAEKSALASSWTRTINTQNQVNWVSGTLSGSCDQSEDLCKATFADGYDPRMHTPEENQNSAITAEEGYVPVQ